MKTSCIAAVMSCALLLCIVTPSMAQGEVWFPTNLMPPPTGVYSDTYSYGPTGYYGGMVVIENLSILHPSSSVAPPEPLIGTQTHTFDSQLDFLVSTDYGLTWAHEIASATETIRLNYANTESATINYQGEIIQLNSTFTLPGGMIMIRESPTLASSGGTSLAPGGGGGGGYMISSFFDVFTEISVDDGQTWSPGTRAAHEELVPEPGTLMTLFAGAMGLLGLRRFRRH